MTRNGDTNHVNTVSLCRIGTRVVHPFVQHEGKQVVTDMVVYLDHVAGPDNQYTISAMNKALNLNPLDAPREKWSQQAIMDAMAHMYPQKYDFVGKGVAAAIVRSAAAQAGTYGLPAQQGATMVLAAIQFALGHRICEDPFYPWIAATLNDPRTVDGEHKLNRLTSKLRTYGRAALTYLTQSG